MPNDRGIVSHVSIYTENLLLEDATTHTAYDHEVDKINVSKDIQRLLACHFHTCIRLMKSRNGRGGIQKFQFGQDF